MTAILAALIAMAGAVIVGYATQFVAEDYRRFRNGSALAAGLAGELGSYAGAAPELRNGLVMIVAMIKNGQRDLEALRPVERPVDLYFEEVVGDLGLLGASLVEDVVLVYSNLRAFRMALEIIATGHKEMKDQEVIYRCQKCLEALDRASERGTTLVESLRARAAERFKLHLPWDT
ncbi:hypothetical protein [Variovorax sp. UC74_104]|uniref:hypothetical protein n=1 Tax=Variovorax sp. UC74_104 TaxID=3374555 RepID=UPI00375666D9